MLEIIREQTGRIRLSKICIESIWETSPGPDLARRNERNDFFFFLIEKRMLQNKHIFHIFVMQFYPRLLWKYSRLLTVLPNRHLNVSRPYFWECKPFNSLLPILNYLIYLLCQMTSYPSLFEKVFLTYLQNHDILKLKCKSLLKLLSYFVESNLK